MMKWLFVCFLPLFALANNLQSLIVLSADNERYLNKELELLQAKLNRQSTALSYLPSLSLQGVYVANNKDSFITDPKESLFAKFSLNFLLFDAFKRENTIAALDKMQNLAFFSKQQSKNYLALQAATLYFNYQSIQILIKANEQKQKLLFHTQNKLEAMQKVGLKSLEELESIKAKYHLVSVELAQNKLKLLDITHQLELLSTQSFTPTKEESLILPSLSLYAEDRQKLQNYETLMQEQSVFISKHNVNIAMAEYFPKIYLQNSLSFYKNNFDFDVPPNFSPFANEFINTYIPKHSANNQFVLGFEWKIFDFNTRGKRTQKQRLELQKQSLELGYKKRELALNLEQSFKELGLLQEQIQALTLALKASDLAFESVDKKFAAGLLSYNDYLTALEQKFKALSDLEFAKNEFEIAKARYYFLTSRDIKERIKP